jgi:hypothetical protein
MITRAKLAVVLYCAFTLVTYRAVAVVEPPLETVIGSAYDLSSGNLVYREHHFCDVASIQCSVNYRDAAGELIAQKLLDYSSGPHSPSLVMKDFRQGEGSSQTLTGNSDWVVDAGFDNYVRSKWDTLDAGDPVKFPFLVPGFEKPLKMRAQRSASESCTIEELCLEIVLDSWLLGLLVDPIALSYSRSERKLLRFRGISNIRDVNGESFSVDIVYEYGGRAAESEPTAAAGRR